MICRGRLQRGRAYAGPNRLMEFAIDGHTIRATVRGNTTPYFGVYEEPHYQLSIRLKTIPKTQWKAIVAELSTSAAWISRLLMGEMPDSIETAFERHRVQLLPGGGKDLIGRCDCPDDANPCKHSPGAYYKVASLRKQWPEPLPSAVTQAWPAPDAPCGRPSAAGALSAPVDGCR